MKVFKYRALLTLDPPASGIEARQHASGTRSLMIHVGHVGSRLCDKYFPAFMTRDAELPLSQGQRIIVTVTVTDDDAPLYLAPGQSFTVWGDCAGHGLISRRVFTDGEPS